MQKGSGWHLFGWHPRQLDGILFVLSFVVMKSPRRTLRSGNSGRGRRRFEITLPEEIVRAAGIEPGDVLDLHVTPTRRIVLTPLRATWRETALCGGLDGRCERAKGHDDECIPVDKVPY